MKFLLFFFSKYLSNFQGMSLDFWKRIFLTVLNTTSGGICFFLTIYFIDFLQFDIVLSSALLSTYGLGTVIGGISSGKLSDFIDPEKIGFYSLFVKAILFFGLVFFKSAIILFVILLMLGITTYSFKTSNYIYILSQFRDNENEKLKAINIIYLASNLGLGLSAVLVSFFSSFGYNLIFLISSICLIVGISFFNVSTSFKTLEIITESTNKDKTSKNKNTTKIGIFILISLFLIGFIVSQRSTTYSIYLTTIFPYLGLKGYSLVFLLNPLLIVFFQAPIVNYFASVNRIFIVGVGGLFMGIGMFILIFSSFILVVFLSCILYTIGEMLFFSNAQLASYQQSPQNRKGYQLGIFQSIYSLSIVSGPILGGCIYHSAGALPLWYLSGLIGIFCFIGCWHLKKFY